MIKRYLGDGVYAEWCEDGYSIRLTTENGVEVTNTIVLGEDELIALDLFAETAPP